MYYLMDAIITGKRSYFIVEKIDSCTAKIIKVLVFSSLLYTKGSKILYFPRELVEKDESIETLEEKYYLSLL